MRGAFYVLWRANIGSKRFFLSRASVAWTLKPPPVASRGFSRLFFRGFASTTVVSA